MNVSKSNYRHMTPLECHSLYWRIQCIQSLRDNVIRIKQFTQKEI